MSQNKAARSDDAETLKSPMRAEKYRISVWVSQKTTSSPHPPPIALWFSPAMLYPSSARGASLLSGARGRLSHSAEGAAKKWISMKTSDTAEDCVLHNHYWGEFWSTQPSYVIETNPNKAREAEKWGGFSQMLIVHLQLEIVTAKGAFWKDKFVIWNKNSQESNESV